MSYELTIKRLPNFLRYVNKVYRFEVRIEILNGVSQTTVTAINEMRNGDVGKFAKPM